MKVIVHTNIIISGLISNNSYPAQIVDGIFEYKFDVCISQAVFDEYLNVLQREKFQKYRNFFFNARLMIEFLSEKALFFEPTTKINILKDPDDNKFLELAMESNADYLITGNINDFTLSFFKNTQIITASAFIINNEKSL